MISRHIEHIYVLPAADLRMDKEPTLALDEWAQPHIIKGLKQKKYAFTISDDLLEIYDVTEKDLVEMKPSWIKELGPSDRRWIMFFSLLDPSSELASHRSGSAELTGFLFDKTSGTVVWRAIAARKSDIKGLIGVETKDLTVKGGIEKATDDILQSLPKNKKR
jgi:hypothetical protein